MMPGPSAPKMRPFWLRAPRAVFSRFARAGARKDHGTRSVGSAHLVLESEAGPWLTML